MPLGGCPGTVPSVPKLCQFLGVTFTSIEVSDSSEMVVEPDIQASVQRAPDLHQRYARRRFLAHSVLCDRVLYIAITATPPPRFFFFSDLAPTPSFFFLFFFYGWEMKAPCRPALAQPRGAVGWSLPSVTAHLTSKIN